MTKKYLDVNRYDKLFVRKAQRKVSWILIRYRKFFRSSAEDFPQRSYIRFV